MNDTTWDHVIVNGFVIHRKWFSPAFWAEMEATVAQLDVYAEAKKRRDAEQDAAKAA